MKFDKEHNTFIISSRNFNRIIACYEFRFFNFCPTSLANSLSNQYYTIRQCFSFLSFSIFIAQKWAFFKNISCEARSQAARSRREAARLLPGASPTTISRWWISTIKISVNITNETIFRMQKVLDFSMRTCKLGVILLKFQREAISAGSWICDWWMQVWTCLFWLSFISKLWNNPYFIWWLFK